MAGVNTVVRGLIQDSGFDAMTIIAAALNAAGHEVNIPSKTVADPVKTVKQQKRIKRANKKTKRMEMEEQANQFKEWNMGGDYKYISDKALKIAIETHTKPIRKPLTGYMKYMNEIRPSLAIKGLNGREIAIEAGRKWREEMSDDDKLRYKQLAITDLENKYGPQKAQKATVSKKAQKATSKKAQKATASKKTQKATANKKVKHTPKKSRKKSPEQVFEDTPVTPSAGMFDSDCDSSNSSDSDCDDSDSD
jgi:hypothetical protein